MWIIYGSFSGDGSPVSGRSVTRDSLMCFLSSWRDGRGTKLNAQNVKKIVPLSKYTYSIAYVLRPRRQPRVQTPSLITYILMYSDKAKIGIIHKLYA